MSLLSIENSLLFQLQQKQSFYDAVTEKYIAQKRRIELCYRLIVCSFLQLAAQECELRFNNCYDLEDEHALKILLKA